jgi:hypothetical protein
VYKMTSRAVMALLILSLLVSCQQLFTTSLGTALARDSYPDLSDISLEDALAYLEEAKANGDVQLASALVSPLFDEAEAAVGTAAYDEAATALVSAVIISSGIGEAVNTGLDLLASSIAEGTVITLEDVAPIIESVTISAASVDALLLVANDPPPSMDATQAYTAAATLLLSIVENTSLTLESSYAEFDGLVDPEQAAAFDAAVALYDHATLNLGGADTAFGDFFGVLPLTP